MVKMLTRNIKALLQVKTLAKNPYVLKNQFKQIEKIQSSSELKTFLMFHATKFYIPVDINPRSIYKNSEVQVEFLKFFAKKNHVNIWFENTIYLIPFKAFSNFPQY